VRSIRPKKVEKAVPPPWGWDLDSLLASLSSDKTQIGHLRGGGRSDFVVGRSRNCCDQGLRTRRMCPIPWLDLENPLGAG
jgi:hypothetical protein